MATNQQARTPSDVVIAGGSHAGMALALALARSLGRGFSIDVLDRAPAPDSADADPRAVAVSAASRHLLQALGVWERLEPVAQPVSRIEITDSALEAGLRPVLLSWDTLLPARTVADHDAHGGEPAAHIVPLPALGRALAAGIAAEPTIVARRPAEAIGFTCGEHSATVALKGGGEVPGRLVVAADGQRSVLRSAAGIKVVGWSYEQAGIVATVRHERPHGGVAVQHFLPGGPFAILPLTGNSACVTWSEGAAEAARIVALDDAGFLAELDKRFGGKLGALSVEGARKSWPLALQLSRAYVAPRLALIGDAARSVHPIAGQGLNLAFRDVAALAEVIADAARTGLDIGSEVTLARYERWRRPDSAMAAAGFDALNRLFSRDIPLLRSGREVGLQLVDRLPVLKSMFMAEAAGLDGELPRLLKGELA